MALAMLLFLVKLNVQGPHALAIARLSIHPREMKPCVHPKTRTQVHSPKLETTWLWSVGEWVPSLLCHMRNTAHH